MRDCPVIALDGPSASGKGTVAKRVAETLGFHYLDSGALYRLTALAARRSGVVLPEGAIEPPLAARIAELAKRLPVEFQGDLILFEGLNVSRQIRDEATSREASRVAALPGVREALMARQRAFKGPPGLVADGRDMASVVFPEATLKVFLTASAEERAQRRYKQLIEKGFDANIVDLLGEIHERDARDASRAHSPLVQDPGALRLDTTQLTIEAAVAQVLAWYRDRSASCV